MNTSFRNSVANSPWVLLLLLTFVGLAAGCSSGSGNLFMRGTPTVLRPGQTNIIERRVTNYVAVTSYLTNLVTLQAASTNAAGEWVPAVVQPQLVPTTTRVPSVSVQYEAQILPPVIVTNLGLAPAVTGAVQVAGDLAPVPWAGGVGNLLLALAGGVFGVINHRRAKQALGEKASWQSAAAVGVQGIEQLRLAALSLPGYTPTMDRHVMQGIVGMQYAAGVKPLIEGLVEAQTERTLPPASHP